MYNFFIDSLIEFYMIRDYDFFQTLLEKKGIMENWNDGILMSTFL